MRSVDGNAKEFGIPLGSYANVAAGGDVEDFRRSVSTLAMSHADLNPVLLRPLLAIGVSMIEGRRSGNRDRAAVRLGSAILTECFAGQSASRQAIVATALARASVRQVRREDASLLLVMWRVELSLLFLLSPYKRAPLIPLVWSGLRFISLSSYFVLISARAFASNG